MRYRKTLDVDVQSIVWTLKHMANVFTCLHPDGLTMSEEEMCKSLVYAFRGGWCKDAQFQPSFPGYPNRSFNQMIHIYTHYSVFLNRLPQEKEIQERRGARSRKNRKSSKYFPSSDCQEMLGDVTPEKKKLSIKRSVLGYYSEPVQKKRKLLPEGHGVGGMVGKGDKSTKRLLHSEPPHGGGGMVGKEDKSTKRLLPSAPPHGVLAMMHTEDKSTKRLLPSEPPNGVLAMMHTEDKSNKRLLPSAPPHGVLAMMHTEDKSNKRLLPSEPPHGVLAMMHTEDKWNKQLLPSEPPHGVGGMVHKEDKSNKRLLPSESLEDDGVPCNALAIVVKEDPEGTLQKLVDCDPQPPGLDVQLIPKSRKHEQRFLSVLPRVGRNYSDFCVHTKPLSKVAKSELSGLAYPLFQCHECAIYNKTLSVKAPHKYISFLSFAEADTNS